MEPATDNLPSARRDAFTLIELLIVISIISLLIAITLPSLRSVRRQAKMAVCGANLKQIGIAMGGYLSTSNDRFPYASFFPSFGPAPIDRDEPLYIADVLGDYVNHDDDVFHCPDDRPGKTHRDLPNNGKSYFQTERSSYEYRISIGPPGRGLPIAGNSMDEVSNRLQAFFGEPFPVNTIWYFRDFAGFHAQRGKNRSRNYLYVDGHVADFEKL